MSELDELERVIDSSKFAGRSGFPGTEKAATEVTMQLVQMNITVDDAMKRSLANRLGADINVENLLRDADLLTSR